MPEFPRAYWPQGYFPAGYFGPNDTAGDIMATLDFEVGAPLSDLHAGKSALSDLSTQAIFIPVTAFRRDTDDAVDPTVNPAWVAFTAGADPAGSAWIPATWFQRTAGANAGTLAAVLVGSGGEVALSPGAVTVWFKVTDSGETLVYAAGILTVR